MKSNLKQKDAVLEYKKDWYAGLVHVECNPTHLVKGILATAKKLK